MASRNELASLHVRAEQLKTSLGSRRRNFIADPSAWTEHQELQSILEKLLLTDLTYALDKKAETDLWNICFKDYINYLQSQIQSNVPRPSSSTSSSSGDAKVTLNWFLEMASGFYFLLLEKIRAKYDLDIPFLRSGSYYGLPSKVTVRPTPSEVSSLNYFCQHCLVHLGDLARYRSQPRQAETFYRQAIQIAPGNGQAYNQIGLLESVLPKADNKLAAVFFYVRSIALRFPFPAGATNLSKLYSRFEARGDEIKPISDASSFISAFLRFQALIHRASRLQMAAKLAGQLSDSLTSLVAAEKLTGIQLIRCVTITIFELDRHLIDGDVGISGDEVFEKMSPEEIGIVRLLSDLLAGMLNAFLLPVYTVKQGGSLLDYFALPATKLILNYVQFRPRLLEEKGFLRRLQIWPSFCRMLNDLSTSLEESKSEFTADVRDKFPLPEEFGLQAFLPLNDSLQGYHFKLVHKMSTPENIMYLRALRLIDIGNFFASELFSGRSVITSTTDDADVKRFEAIEQNSEKVSDLLEGLVLDSSDSECDPIRDQDDEKAVKDDDDEDSVSDDRVGILKQRHDEKVSSPIPELEKKISTGKRFSRQNVAMNAIMNRAAAKSPPEQVVSKQVTFKTPSPAPSNGTGSQEDPNSQQSNISQESAHLNQVLLQQSQNQQQQQQQQHRAQNFPPPTVQNFPTKFSAPPPPVPVYRPVFDSNFPFLDSFTSSTVQRPGPPNNLPPPYQSGYASRNVVPPANFSGHYPSMRQGLPAALPPYAGTAPPLRTQLPQQQLQHNFDPRSQFPNQGVRGLREQTATNNLPGNLYGDYALFANHPTWSAAGQQQGGGEGAGRGGDLFGQLHGSPGGPSPLERLLQQQQQQQQGRNRQQQF